MTNIISVIWEGICKVLYKPINGLLEWFEPFWNFLVKHDRYVYVFLAVISIIGI